MEQHLMQDRIMGAVSYGGGGMGFSSKSQNYGSFINNWNPPMFPSTSGGDYEGPGYSSCFSGNSNGSISGSVSGSVSRTGGEVSGTISGENLINVDTQCIANVWSGNDDNSDGVDDWSGEFDDPGSC